MARAETLSQLLSTDDMHIFKESDLKMRQLGFEDYAAEATQSLNDTSISSVSKLALKKNASYLNSLNASRELANLAFVLLQKSITSSSFDKEIDIFTAVLEQQLAPFPLLTREPLSAEQEEKIQALNTTDAMKLKRSFYYDRASNRYLIEKRNLVKAFSKAFLIAHPESVGDVNKIADLERWLDQNISDAIIDAYSTEVRQQNRFLGRALSLSLVRFFRTQNLKIEEAKLKYTLSKSGIYLQNQINAQYVFKTEQGDLRGYNLKSGDIAFEYSHGQEAFFTSLLASPQESADDSNAKRNNLKNSLWDATKFLDTDTYYDVLDKRDSRKKLTAKELKIYENFWNRKYANGFSHSGFVEVRKDNELGLSVAWIWDIYPENDKVGPVRLMTPEGFAFPEEMLKIGFLSYDPYKILKSFKGQVKKRGYLTEIWKGYSSFVGKYADGSSGPSIDTDIPYTWKAHVDKATVLRWAQTPDAEADRWYFQEVIPRITKRLRSYAVGPHAALFADGLVTAKDMYYCSQLIAITYLEEINLDLQNSTDKVWTLISYLTPPGRMAKGLDLKSRLISPNGLIWQDDIFGNLFYTFLDRSRVKAQETQKSPTVAESYSKHLENTLNLHDYPLTMSEDDELGLVEDAIVLDLES